jgi:hypothetical protein
VLRSKPTRLVFRMTAHGKANVQAEIRSHKPSARFPQRRGRVTAQMAMTAQLTARGPTM